jgi:hypothetical protein
MAALISYPNSPITDTEGQYLRPRAISEKMYSFVGEGFARVFDLGWINA